MTRGLRATVLAGLWIIAAAGGLPEAPPAQAKEPPAQQGAVAAAQSMPPGKSPPANALDFRDWPVLAQDPEGIFLYATRGGTNIGISPYQNNLAIGTHTLNPATHHSERCNSSAGFDGFCGDEVAFGGFTLQHDVTGRDNTAIGDHALANLTTGIGNTAVGSSAAANIHTSGGVDAFGVAACQDGSDYHGPMTCIGQAAFEFAGPRSQYSVALGYQAGLHAATAEFSTLLGSGAGFNAETASYSVLIGEGACHGAKAIRNVICIGTLNGPSGGIMSDQLWLGGNNGGTPLLLGDMRSNALGLNTTALTPGAALTVGSGHIALPAASAIQWNGDAGISRKKGGQLAIGNGTPADASGTLELGKITLSSGTSITAPSAGEMNVAGQGTSGAGGHIVSAYIRTVPTTIGQLSTIDPSPTLGDRALVTDAKNCTFGMAVAQGGSTTCPVYYNGAAWAAG